MAYNEKFPYEQVDYMKRQPRTDVTKMNYNFEQMREYTAMYETARIKDKEDSENFYKMVKYARLRTKDGEQIDRSNLVVRDFIKKY